VAIPPPKGAVELNLPGHDPCLPKLYRIPTHLLIKNCKANIILGMWDWDKKFQAELLKHSSTFQLLSNAAEQQNFGKSFIFYSTLFNRLTRLGIVTLTPSKHDVFVICDLYGSEKLKDNCLHIWMVSR